MPRDQALVDLLLHLKEREYRFMAVTPASHARVLARAFDDTPTLRDIFGWNRPFRESQLEAPVCALMEAAGILREGPDGLLSALRVATLSGDLFFHSAYPTEDADAVFFGPDTYRFARFIKQSLPPLTPAAVTDMGAGSGAGGLLVKRLAPTATVTLVDTNRAALDLAGVNARACGRQVELLQGSAIPASCDLVVANPPYMMDEGNRAYRDGGELFGGEVALDWARDALVKLAPGGAMLLYTGAAIVDGSSPLLAELTRMARDAGASMSSEEIDPDVFGEELEKPPYARVERIAAIGAVIRTAR